MKNRIAGYIVIGIALLIGFIVYSFNRALTEIANASCTHGTSCPMWGTISFQTNMGLGIMVLVVLVGLYLVFFGKEEKVVTRTVKEQIKPKDISKENYEDILKESSEEEKKILEELIGADGTIFQSDLVEKLGFTKVKVTRVLDRLEGKGLVERKRRGMTNVVILK